MKFIPLVYEILPGLQSTSTQPATSQPRDIPGYVITLLAGSREKLQLTSNGPAEIKHNDGFFFEDKNHDWIFRDGKFYYFSHAIGAAARAESPEEVPTADVLIVYKWMEIRTPLYGQIDGKIYLKSVRHGFPMDISLINFAKVATDPSQWTATFSQPASSRLTLQIAEDIAQNQLDLIALAKLQMSNDGIFKNGSDWRGKIPK